jgi:hypothetical protein
MSMQAMSELTDWAAWLWENAFERGAGGRGDSARDWALISSAHDWRRTWGERIAKDGWIAGCAWTWHQKFW